MHLIREHTRRERRIEWWHLGDDLCVTFIATLNRPCVFVNYQDWDIFSLLIDAGFLNFAQEIGLSVDTPHGKGHNCFKTPSETLMLFLSKLHEFFKTHMEEIGDRMESDERVPTWKESWWDNPTGQ